MRITGRQLRQIIKEEVSRAVLKEADAITVTDMNSLIDAVTQLENAIQDHIGQNLGAAVSQFVAAAKGQKNVVWTTLMAEAGQLAQMGDLVGLLNAGGEQINHKTLIGVTKAILAANGKKNVVNLYGYPADITIDGETLVGSGILATGADERELAYSIGKFMFERML